MRKGLMKVAAAGGEPTSLIESVGPNAPDYQSPAFVPGGRAVLFTLRPRGGGAQVRRVAVVSLDSGEQRELVEGSDARVASSGHLIFARDDSLWAAPFDIERLELTGDPVPVVENVQTSFGRADYGLATDGSLAYRTPITTNRRSLVWVSRDGREEPVGAPFATYAWVTVSPDGTRVALDASDAGNSDIWIWDIARRAMSRLAVDPGSDQIPVWWPDGQRVLFESHRDGPGMVYSRAADGNGPVTLVHESPAHQLPTSVSADGRQLVAEEVGREGSGGSDLALISLDGESRTAPLIRTPFNERQAKLSPDGRWLAYYSDESGQAEVYVRPFPGVNADRWQVSVGGGTQPIWHPNRLEMFYWNPAERAVMAVPFSAGLEFSAGIPERLFQGPYDLENPARRTYDVAPDGERFLMIKNDSAAAELADPSQIVLVTNWLTELKRLVPTN